MTEAVPRAVPSRSQVTAEWQESFNRLNESVPGISGFLSFSEVCCILLERKKKTLSYGNDHNRRHGGISRRSFSLGILYLASLPACRLYSGRLLG